MHVTSRRCASQLVDTLIVYEACLGSTYSVQQDEIQSLSQGDWHLLK